jgi:hypothetical protein
MKGKTEFLTNFKFFFIPTVEMLQKEFHSLCNFSFTFLKIVKIELANKVQSFFSKRNNTELAIYALEQVHCWGTYFRARTSQFENFTHLNF